MRVAVISWSARCVGGIEEYVSVVIPALRGAGVDVAFWHELDEPADRARIERRDDVADFCAAELGLQPALDALRAWKPDVLYVQGLSDPRVTAKVLEIAPAVLFLHAYIGTCISGGKTWTRPTVLPCDRKFGAPCLLHYFPHGCGGNNPITMWRLYQQQSHRLRLLGRYRTILTHTDHMRREMARHGLASLVIPYPIEAPPRNGSRTDDGTWRLLFAGRMEMVKGGDVLIDAMPAVTASLDRPVRVLMAGDGTERARWEARARRVERRTPAVTFEFPGWVAQDRLGVLMSTSDLLVVPSRWPEPFGGVGPAAAQCGLPAAAFDVGGISQWLVDGVAGHLASGAPPTAAGLAHAIVQCLEDPVHRAALKHGARETAKTFTMARHLPALVAALERARCA